MTKREKKKEEKLQRELEAIEDHRSVAYKAGTPLYAGKISETDQIHLFNDMNPKSRGQQTRTDSPEESNHVEDTVSYPFPHPIPPKVLREENDPEVREGIEQIGGGPGEVRDIDGRLITPEDARVIQRKETECLYPTGKGSLSARAQSAAAANVREGKVEENAGPCATLNFMHVVGSIDDV